MEEMNFDPITGKPLKNQETAREDQEILFDPMTGKPVGKPKDPEKPYAAGAGELQKPRKVPAKEAIGQLRRYIPAAVAALAALIILIVLFRLFTGGGRASSVPPLLFYQTEEGALMTAKTSGGAPERLLNAGNTEQ